MRVGRAAVGKNAALSPVSRPQQRGICSSSPALPPNCARRWPDSSATATPPDRAHPHGGRAGRSEVGRRADPDPDATLDFLTATAPSTLEATTELPELALVTAYVGSVRLIDILTLNLPHPSKLDRCLAEAAAHPDVLVARVLWLPLLSLQQNYGCCAVSDRCLTPGNPLYQSPTAISSCPLASKVTEPAPRP